ncbi:MAG TPA: hypothetical protein VFW33_11385, partial [Gemmataceae bacterium]|nr:hypothetical protein [Gemmataceae bacterium]
VAAVALPMVVAFHPAYTFLFAPWALVLAGHGTARVWERLRPLGAPVAVAWLLGACCLDLPRVASYYRDGSRYDYRTAALYIHDHFRPGDRVAAVSPGLMGHYAAECQGGIRLPTDPLPALPALAEHPGRTWVAVASNRSGKDEALRHWLARNCSAELVARHTRFDYYDYTVEVFLCPGVGSGAEPRP